MRKLAILIAALALVSAPGYAQIPGTLGFDVDPGTPHFVGSPPDSSIVDDNSDIDLNRSVPSSGRFSTLVRLNGTSNLMGLSFDFEYDETVLTLVEIRETHADLNFNGRLALNELNAGINLFVAAQPVSALTFQYNDALPGQTPNVITTNPGILLDPNNSGTFALGELNSVINEFVAGNNDIPFWTEILSRRAGVGQPFLLVESVEVFDDIDDIRATGIAADNTVVLLARPGDGRDANTGAIVPGYGFDGDAIIFEAIFQPAAGSSGKNTNITISNAVGIDETFNSLADVKPIANVVTSNVAVQ